MQRSPIRGEDAANAAGEGTADGAHSAPVSKDPRGRVIPAKAGTYWEDRPSTRKREPTHSPNYGYEIPAYAGMTVIGRLRASSKGEIPAFAGMTVRDLAALRLAAVSRLR